MQLQQPGKRLNGVARTPTNSCLYIKDPITNITFLVDTGSCISILPAALCKDKGEESNLPLKTVSGSPIKTYGERILKLSFGLRREFTFSFLVCEVNNSILGADFLNHFNLVVDIFNAQLIDNTTKLHSVGVIKCSKGYPVLI